MAEPPHTKDRGRLYWEAQIFGPNPFPSDDPRHGWWRQMAAWAAEADERLDAAIRLRNQDGRGDSWPVDLFVGRLDIIAEALLRSSVRDFEDAAKFKAVLAAAADQFLGAVQSMTMPYVQKESLVWDLRSTLSQRSAYWFAEALKVAREAEEQLAQNPVVSSPPPSLGVPDLQPPTSAGVFRRGANGEWELGFGTSRCVGVKHVEGMLLIRTLLAAPGQEFSASALISDGVMPVDAQRTVNARPGEDGYTEDGLVNTAQISQWDGVPTLDDQAEREARAELRRLLERRQQAEANGNVEENDRLDEEIDALTQQLSADLGLRGPRTLGSDRERARKTAGKRYRTALKAVGRSLPDLAKHLKDCINPGARFRYLPDKPILWKT